MTYFDKMVFIISGISIKFTVSSLNLAGEMKKEYLLTNDAIFWRDGSEVFVLQIIFV